MKIINIMSSKILGGVEQAFLDYNDALSSKGNQVFAIYNKYGKIKNKIKQKNNIKYIPSIFFKPSFLLFPYFLFKIMKIKPDIIIVQSRKVIPLFSGISHLLNIPIVLVCHSNKTKLINRADYLFSITEYQKEIMIKSGYDKNKIFVIPNLISEKLDFKNFDNFSKPPVFGIIGRFDPIKGFPLFIKACHELKNRGINFQAKIAGTPQLKYMDEYKKIKRLVKSCNLNNDIEFLGWIDKKEEFYNCIDIFVSPSISESFGIVLLEAMMHSKPIISSLAEGPKEIFENTNSALTFEPNNCQELAEKMIKLINDIDLAKKIAKNGYDLVNKKYSIDVVSDILENSIEKCLKYSGK